MSSSQREAIATSLWARHVPDKNLYDCTKTGRPVVIRRVFQREKAPMWTFYQCERCVSLYSVCRRHQFVLHGEDGVRHYVESQLRCLPKTEEMVKRDVQRHAVLSKEGAYAIRSAETADRVDIMDEYLMDSKALWWEFRRCRSEIFREDTGIHLPICCKFPRDNLYKAFTDHHKRRA